jgi:hypothetical protein
VYVSLAETVRLLRDGVKKGAAAELRSLCAAHGAEAALNAVYIGQRLDARARVADALGEQLPPQAGLFALFDVAQLPDPNGLEFVRVRLGASDDAPRYGWGWLVRREAVHVLWNDLSMTRLDPASGPALAPPGGGDGTDPFRAYCRVTFSAQLPDPRDGDPLSFDGSEALRSCVLAYWSFRRGDVGHAIRLFEHSAAIFAHPLFRRRSDEETFEQFVGEELATALEQRSVLAAADGEAREALRHRWRCIARVRADRGASPHDPPTVPSADLGGTTPFHRFGWHEPGDMVRYYDRLISEDEAWREPRAEELARWEPPALSQYWMHKLRDSVAGRYTMGSHAPSVVSWGPPGDPARRLIALGWSAIPDLIEHYDDPAPIRGYRSYYSRATGEVSCTPWRHGDACVEIVKLVTGNVFRTRADVAEWWKTARKGDLPGFYLRQLRSGDAEEREKAALWLVTLDDRAHADAVVTRVIDGDPSRNAMLAFLKGHVHEAEADRLVPLLKCGEFRTVVATAWALRDTVRGRDATRALLERVLAEPSGDRARFGLHHLAAMQDEDLSSRYANALRTAPAKAREALLDSAHLFPGPNVLDALVGFLGEDGRALIAVKRMLIYPLAGGDAETRERMEWREAEVREWLARNDPDWASLRQRIRAGTSSRGAEDFYPLWFRW